MTDLILPYSKPVLRPVLDLTVSAWKKNHGDLDVYGSWWLDTDNEAPWPCLVIVPAHKSMMHSYAPCVVSVDLAWIWSEEEGDPEFAAQTAMKFCDALGLANNVKNCMRIASIVRDHLEDLLRIGPRPKSLEQTVADAIVKIDGKERHSEVKEPI